MSDRPHFTSSYSRKPYNEIVEDILNEITKGTTKEKFVFKSSQFDYLLPARARNVVEIEGTANGKKLVFEKNSDYVFLADRSVVSWKGKTRPDDGTEFKVTYSFKNPS